MWMAGAILGKWKVSSCHIVIALPLKFFYCYNCTSLKKYLNEENYIFFFVTNYEITITLCGLRINVWFTQAIPSTISQFLPQDSQDLMDHGLKINMKEVPSHMKSNKPTCYLHVFTVLSLTSFLTRYPEIADNIPYHWVLSLDTCTSSKLDFTFKIHQQDMTWGFLRKNR